MATKNLPIYVPPALHRQIRLVAQVEGKPVAAVVVETAGSKLSTRYKKALASLRKELEAAEEDR